MKKKPTALPWVPGKMGKEFRNITTVVSLLVSIALIALWISSYWVSYGVRHINVYHRYPLASQMPGCDFRAVLLGDNRGMLIFLVGGVEREDESTYRWPTGLEFLALDASIDVPDGFHGLFSLGYFKWTTVNRAGTSQHYVGLSIPIAVPALALIVPSATYLNRTLRRRKRNRQGLCLRCGYDLRATQGRCPECGAEDHHAAGSTRN